MPTPPTSTISSQAKALLRCIFNILSVLVVGAASFIRSRIGGLLQERKLHRVVLPDHNYSFAGAVSGAELITDDTGDCQILDKLLKERRIDAVMHFASFIQVGESVYQTTNYNKNNVGNTLRLFGTMARHSAYDFIFSPTPAILDKPMTDHIDDGNPQKPINLHGRTQWLAKQLLPAYVIRQVFSRCFNSPFTQPNGRPEEIQARETRLIKRAISAALDRSQAWRMFGNRLLHPGRHVRERLSQCV